jgi:hypothetical protein
MGRVAAHQHTPRVERLASSPAGAGRFVAGTVARMQNATALFMNVVEEEFCELRLLGILGSSQRQATHMQPHKYVIWVMYRPAVSVTVVASTKVVVTTKVAGPIPP